MYERRFEYFSSSSSSSSSRSRFGNYANLTRRSGGGTHAEVFIPRMTLFPTLQFFYFHATLCCPPPLSRSFLQLDRCAWFTRQSFFFLFVNWKCDFLVRFIYLFIYLFRIVYSFFVTILLILFYICFFKNLFPNFFFLFSSDQREIPHFWKIFACLFDRIKVSFIVQMGKLLLYDSHDNKLRFIITSFIAL